MFNKRVRFQSTGKTSSTGKTPSKKPKMVEVDWDIVPDRLRPLNLHLRSKDQELTFPYLKGVSLTDPEKKWFCDQIDQGHWNPYDVFRLYGIPRTTVQTWVEVKRDPRRNCFLNPGRPSLLDQQSKIITQNYVFSRDVESRNAVPSFHSKDLFAKEIKETRKRRFNDDEKIEQKVTISDRSEKRYKEEWKITDKTPQPITEARIKASFCPRVTYIWLVTILTLSGHLKADNKWNLDGTTFRIMAAGSGSKVLIVRDEEEDFTSNQPIRSSSIPSSSPVYIKWLELCSASGELSPLVFWIAVENMEPEAFHVEEVLGLSTVSGNAQLGYLIFTKSRAGNLEAWKWWFKNVTIPTINLSKNLNDHKVSPLSTFNP